MFAYCLNNPIIMADYEGRDAIVVVNFSYENGGLPIVGHSSVYIQDDAGRWYFTEYTGQFPYKSTAEVVFERANMDDVNDMLEGEKIQGIKYTTIKGDFSASVDLARSCAGTPYGRYHFFSNNCADYVQDIINVGDVEDELINKKSEKSSTPIPAVYQRQMNRAAKGKGFLRGVIDIVKGWVS